MLVTISFTASNWRVSGIGIEQFYPFGLESGDSQLEKADDEFGDSVQIITLSSSFEFFNQPFTSVSVSDELWYVTVHAPN